MDPGEDSLKASREGGKEVDPRVALMKHTLLCTECLFEDLLNPKTMATTESIRNYLIDRTLHKLEARSVIGASPGVWTEYAIVFDKAVKILEKNSFAAESPKSDQWQGSSSLLIASQYTIILKHIAIIHDLVKIASYILVPCKAAQNLAAQAKVDHQVLRLIDVCVRVTARSYEGQPQTKEEERWQQVVHAYKKLLITSLQWLYNSVTLNEHQKLMLWLVLFGDSARSDLGLEAPKEYYVEDVENAVPIAEQKTTGHTEDLQVLIDKLTLLPNQKNSSSDPLGTNDSKSTELVTEHLAMTLPDHADSTDVSTIVRALSMKYTLSREDYKGSSLSTVSLKNKTTKDAFLAIQEAKRKLVASLRDEDASAIQEGAQDHNASSEIKKVSNTDPANHSHETNGAAAASAEEEDDEEDEEEDDELEEGYRGPGDQARGILTDIPLILGPDEIEVLPMLISSGLLRPPSDLPSSESKSDLPQNLQTVRCNILLSQESGRNLLREMLIFVAAWDLREKDFYVQAMMIIFRQILVDELVPFSYQSFGEAKDIVSPAQTVVVKLLTHIFRENNAKAAEGTNKILRAATQNSNSELPSEILAVRYLFTVFRQHIVPETCALIYLQGLIRKGTYTLDDFPINLWDVERVYEGIYQFLEFFAVLTESDEWKNILIRWEFAFELLALLRELNAAIPRGQPGATDYTSSVTSTVISQFNAPLPLSVERPYDPVPVSSADQAPDAAASAVSDDAEMGAEEPAEFEWRNLKKLIILIMCSLTWKSRTVQDQVRKLGGVELVLNCTAFDAHNPYIREHSILCIRFLMEGNRENQKIVSELEARNVVPNEMFDDNGHEAYLDQDEKVQLRRKVPKPAPAK